MAPTAPSFQTLVRSPTSSLCSLVSTDESQTYPIQPRMTFPSLLTRHSIKHRIQQQLPQDGLFQPTVFGSRETDPLRIFGTPRRLQHEVRAEFILVVFGPHPSLVPFALETYKCDSQGHNRRLSASRLLEGNAQYQFQGGFLYG